MEWMANTHPSTENIVGCTTSEDISMKENLNLMYNRKVFKWLLFNDSHELGKS